MLAIVIGLASALTYGVADFFGGLAAKRTASVVVTAFAALVGLVVLLPATLLMPGRPSFDAFLWGGLSGITGAAAIFLLYAALAIGPMSILSPLTAVLSALVPMTWGLVGGERLPWWGYVALGGVLVAIVLVGFVPEKGAVRPRLRGVVYATLSGLLIGCFFIFVDQAPADSGLYPIVANRIVAGSILFVVLGVLLVIARRRGVPPFPGLRGAWGLIVACGIADAAANVLILTGLRMGDLTVMSVLAALYPGGTIALAALVLRERIAPVQWVGLVLALASAAVLAIPA
ncbi:DMT family transporter [Pseudolysinimonas sp.]|uniref:DMT family transporter n=1 Tax=Pseudolysinimonas sp. TaxID=2680009 RepID=UPI00286D00AD|nr:DMT family transporter [Pseudolysinimonas sp.]